MILLAGVIKPERAYAETRIIPDITLAERYDTNVFLAPPQLLSSGQRRDDFVSTLAGGVKLHHKSRDVEASVTGGVAGNAYVYNPNLNYLSTAAEADAKLDGWVGQLAKGATLRISERFQYTPEPPSFLTGVKAPSDDPFSRGVQSFRANTFSSTTSANGSYPVFRGLSIQGSYAFSFYRVGSILALTTTGASFFDTNVHTWSAGPQLQLTPADSVSLSYQQSLVSQSQTATGVQLDFNTQQVWANYKRVTPDWTAGISGGGTLIEPFSKVFATGTVYFLTAPDRSTLIRLDLSRLAAPSLFFIAGPLISHVAQVELSYQLSKRLRVTGRANYGVNETTDSVIKFENQTASAVISYSLTRSLMADLSYSYSKFTTDQQTGLDFTVLRNVVAISLTAQWK